MKKIISLLILFVATVTFYSQTVEIEAQQNIIIKIESATITPRNTVAIPIVATIPTNNLGAATIEIQYNPDMLQVIECEPNNSFDSQSCNSSFAEDTIRFNVISLNGMSGEIQLAVLEFEAIGQIGNISPLRLTLDTIANALGETIVATPIDGQVCIGMCNQTNIIGVGSSTILSGDTTTVPVTASIQSNSLGAATIEIEYDPSIIQVNSCTINDDFDSKTCNSDFSNNTIRFNVVSLSGLSGEFELATLEFEAIGQISEISPLTVTVRTIVNATGEDLPITTENGEICIGSCGGGLPVQGVIAIGSDSVLPNEQVTISVTALITSHQLGAATIDITYKSAVLQIVECIPDSNFDSKTCNPSFADDTIRFNVVSLDGLSGEIILASLTFEAIGQVDEESSLEVNVQTIVRPTGEILSVATENGQINIIQDIQTELQITKTAYQEYSEALHVRDRLTYEIVLTNLGPRVAKNLVIQDVLPNSLHLDMFTTTDGSISSAIQSDGSTLVQIDIIHIGIDDQVTVNLTATVKEKALGASVVNIAEVQYDGGRLSSGVVVNPDPNSSNPTIQPALPKYTYLPLIMRQPTPIPTPTRTSTPTPTPTSTPVRIPTSTPTSVTQQVVNGNFEQGNFGWTEYSSNGWPLIMQTADFPEGFILHSGNWGVWLGGDENETAYIRQSVTVPPNAPYFTYWYWISSQDVCGYDFGGIGIDGTWYDRYDLCDSNDTNGWVFRTIDMRVYAGQRINLDIVVITDDSNNSNLFVDDVSFRSNRMISQQTVQYNFVISSSTTKIDLLK